MISVAEARARILEGVRPTAPETVALSAAWNRILAQPVVARRTQPPEAVSAMDGYALRSADGAVGAALRVIGNVPAGHPFAGTVGPGEAVRIFTGSIVPLGADAILLQEDATRDGDRVIVGEKVECNRHVRARGQDFVGGDMVLAPGRLLTARDIGLAAAADYPWLVVHRRPRIAVLATGDEIAMPGEPVPPGGIVSSNSHALAALIRAGGGDPMLLPIARDDTATIAAVADQVAGCDMLVTTGGASVGEHDLIQSALGERGLQLDFWKIAMRPGKPLMHGHLGAMPMLGLPGNPVSTIVCAILFLLPALARLSGLPGAAPRTVPARLGVKLRANDHRADYLRGTLAEDAAGLTATPFERQDSALLQALARADALILRAPHAPALAAGEMVEVIPLGTLGI